MAKRDQDIVSRMDRIVFFANDGEGVKNFCEVLEVGEVAEDRVIARNRGYVLPLQDAQIFNSPDGMVYAYNMNLPYLSETKHLAEVEKNIIVGQAFLYAGRNSFQSGKTSSFMWVVLAFFFILAMIGMFK